MAVVGPIGNDNLDISFRLHSKSHVFDGSSSALANAKLNALATASSYGLVFVASTASEILVLCMKDLELPNAIASNAPVRKVPMPSPVTQIATNCDGSILAVDVKVNGVSHIQLYSVASFLTPSVQKLREFRASADNASSTQLCWNPVICTVLAICTESGGLNLYVLKDQGIEFHAIDPALKARCCCWSPKGKQIVAGFANGKLMQFNMELKPARTIECPPGTMQGGSFDTIAIQWLSTYQFAIALLSHAVEESRPVIHILNAPKAGPLQCIAYPDVCYSTSEVRPSKVFIQYIQQWGLLLVASANCVDISFLRITKPGDIPEWTQEFPNDQFPGELPLTPEKEESFPIGFELDIACSGRLLHEDGSQYPVMPMIHLLSTYGVLCSFYFVNTTPSYVDICSPPRPIDPRVQSFFAVNNIRPPQNIAVREDPSTPIKPTMPAPISHSTPAAPPKTTNLFSVFGATASIPVSSVPPMSQSNAFSGFSLPPSSTLPPPQQQPQQMPKPVNQAQNMTFQVKPTTNVTVPPNNQPLITIPPTYNPTLSQIKPESKENSSKTDRPNDGEDEQVYVKMIHDEMKAFELELSFIMEKSRSLKVSIGTKEESAEMRRKLEELDELKKEATETVDSLRSDVQTNRLVLTELFSMTYEAKSKCDQANDEKSLIMTPTHDRTSKRTLETLKRMISQCEMQVQVSVQLLRSQWANYQETLGKNKKNKMHIPSLEGVYQTLTKQQEIIYNLNGKLKMLKTKLGIFDDIRKQKGRNTSNAAIESLSDSIISMSLIDQVQNENSRLTEKKLKNLLNHLEGREVVTIKPQRPQLPGLNSEIVIEMKIKALKSIKRPEIKKQEVKTPAPTIVAVQNIPSSAQTAPQSQPTETVFNLSQKASPFTALPVAPTSSAPPQISFGKKSEGLPSQPFFNLSGSTSTVPQQPSFGFSSGTLISNSEKRKEEVAFSKTQAPPKVADVFKPPSTITNANVSVSANFSLSLPSKTSPSASKDEIQRVEQKRPEEGKQPLLPAPTTNETTTFTFSLPGMKDTASKQSTTQAAAVSFGSTTANASDPIKSAFSFGANQSTNSSPPTSSSFSFVNLSKAVDTKAVSSSSSSTSIFGGTVKAPLSGFSSNSADANKSINTATILGSALSTPKSNEEGKSAVSVIATTPSITATITTTPASNSTGFSFGSINAPSSESKTTFSFANFGASISSATSAPPTQTATQATSMFGLKSPVTSTIAVATTSPTITSASSAADSVLSGLKICSPDVSKTQETQATPSGSIFGGSNVFKSDSSSIFGGNAFSSTFGNSASPTITKSPVVSSASPSTGSPSTSSVVASTQSNTSSIFGTQTSITPTQGSTLFGAPSPDANKPQTPGAVSTPPSSNIFGTSLVKPDQTVFSQPTAAATVPTTSAPSFGNIFGGGNTATTSAPAFGNIFGGSTQSASPTAAGSNIFAAATTAAVPSTNIFAQANQAQQQSSPSASIFGQASATAPAANTSGSLFSQSSFSAPSAGTSIFGGASAQPFGAASIFGASGQQSSSIFGGGSSSFGAQTSSNIFGASSPSAVAPQAQSTSPFGSSNIFTQQNSQSQPVFGGNATFSNTFGQSTFGSSSIFGQQQQQQQQPSQPVFGGGATFGSPKANIFSAAATSPQQVSGGGGQSNIFEQLGSQQSGNLFGNLATQQQPPPQQQQQQQQQQGGFSGSAFSSWR